MRPTLCLLTFLCLMLGGCSVGRLSSSQQYQLADTSYRTVVSAVTDLSRTGVLDNVPPNAIEKFESVRRQADALLTSWETAILSGTTFTQLDLLNHLLDEMIQFQLTTEGTANVRTRNSRSTWDSQSPDLVRAGHLGHDRAGTGREPRSHRRGTHRHPLGAHGRQRLVA